MAFQGLQNFRSHSWLRSTPAVIPCLAACFFGGGQRGMRFQGPVCAIRNERHFRNRHRNGPVCAIRNERDSRGRHRGGAVCTTQGGRYARNRHQRQNAAVYTLQLERHARDWHQNGAAHQWIWSGMREIATKTARFVPCIWRGMPTALGGFCVLVAMHGEFDAYDGAVGLRTPAATLVLRSLIPTQTATTRPGPTSRRRRPKGSPFPVLSTSASIELHGCFTAEKGFRL